MKKFLFLLILPFSVQADEFSDKILPVLDEHCLKCHDGFAGKPKGDFDIEPFYNSETAKANPDAFKRIRNALHFFEMPPAEESQPSLEERQLVQEWITRQVLHQPTFHGERDPGPPVRRRLTRLEYNNTVRDLLGLSTDVFIFPERLMARRDYFDPSGGKLPDVLDISIPEYGANVPALLKIASLPGDNAAEHAFFNQGETLNVTPLLMERYLSVATAIVKHPDFLAESPEMAELLGQPIPQASGGGFAGESVLPAEAQRDYAPVDNIQTDAADSSDQAWLFRDHVAAAYDAGEGGIFQHPDGENSTLRGVNGSHIRMTFGRNNEKALLIRPNQDLWFVDFGTAHETSPPSNITNRQKGQKKFHLEFEIEGARHGTGITSLGVVVLSRAKQSQGPVTLTAHFASGETSALTEEIATGAGEDNTFFAWQVQKGDAITGLTVDGSEFSGDYVLLDDLGFITGHSPVLAESTKPKTVEPELEREPQDLKGRFTEFLTRAFRHELTEEEIQPYWAFYESERAAGQAREAAMTETVRAVLSSPRFLMLTEKTNGDDPVRPLRDFELANRLSYFLWSSMPDEELSAAARAGKLTDPAELEKQVLRMLRDPRAKELSDSFAYQWLKLNVLLGSQPDERRYRNFYDGPKGKRTMAAPFLQEALLLFETTLVENQPITDLIDPDYTWMNPRLIEFYGFEDRFADKIESATTIDKNGKPRIDDDKWFRCELPDRTRGGVLCMGGTLTLNSLPLRTSPVYRGAWVTEVVFNRAPPPPPAMVDELGEDDREMQEEGLTLRQKLAQHASDASCAGCHARIDPLGFPLENFDGIGQWRDDYGQLPVDSSGVLMRQYEYDGIIEFKDVLREREDDFVRGFIRHLLAYALGRKLEAYDEWAIDELQAEVKAKGLGLQDLIMAIAKSYPFTHTRNAEEESEPVASR